MVDLCLPVDEVFESVTGENAATVGGFGSSVCCALSRLLDPAEGDMMMSSQGVSFYLWLMIPMLFERFALYQPKLPSIPRYLFST